MPMRPTYRRCPSRRSRRPKTSRSSTEPSCARRSSYSVANASRSDLFWCVPTAPVRRLVCAASSAGWVWTAVTCACSWSSWCCWSCAASRPPWREPGRSTPGCDVDRSGAMSLLVTDGISSRPDRTRRTIIIHCFDLLRVPEHCDLPPAGGDTATVAVRPCGRECPPPGRCSTHRGEKLTMKDPRELYRWAEDAPAPEEGEVPVLVHALQGSMDAGS